jgi:hypothetical protein
MALNPTNRERERKKRRGLPTQHPERILLFGK